MDNDLEQGKIIDQHSFHLQIQHYWYGGWKHLCFKLENNTEKG